MGAWADFGVVWTVRAALACYVAALAIRILADGRRPWRKAARAAWTAGYAFFLLHLAAAFHFVHGWSHDAAYRETARRTYEVVGLDWGGGVYVNHAFALVWGMDVVWWWLSLDGYSRRSRWIEWGIQGLLGFVAFNSTAIFGRGSIRWFGWGAGLALAMMWARSAATAERGVG
jgi:hypothetical protein